jgi:hypothetical protein
MMQVPQPDPRRYDVELKIREQELIRDLKTYPQDTSRLSRRAYVLIQLTVILLIIVGLVIVYHLLH